MHFLKVRGLRKSFEQSVAVAGFAKWGKTKRAIEVLKGVEGIGFTFFQAKDVVRHSLVQKVIVAYEKAGRDS